MLIIISKVLASALIIAFVSWLSGKKLALAGFLTALPLTTLIALAFSHIEYNDTNQSVEFAKSIFVAVPISLLFFVPFFMAQKFNLGFWSCYTSGIVLLGIGYLAHQHISKFL